MNTKFCLKNSNSSPFKNWISVGKYLDLRHKNVPYYGDLYAYAANNPVRYVDPDGRSTEVTIDNDGNYVVTGGRADEDRNIYIMKGGNRTGEILGQSFTPYSFLDNKNNPVLGAKLSLDDTSGEDFLIDFRANTPTLLYYIFNGGNGKEYDFKALGIEKILPATTAKKSLYHYRGMIITDNTGNKVFASARDVGNYAAGFISGRCGYLSWNMARLAFDFYNGSSEPSVTQRAEWEGYLAGVHQNSIDSKRILERIQSHH